MAVVASGQAAVVVEWVSVGDPGNVDDVHGDGFGGVAHEYRIGKFEVTNGQYREFLNAVAAVGDPNGLYNIDGEAGGMGGTLGGIARSGSGTVGDPWVYTAKDGDPNWNLRPVNFVSWFDALRFANWLHNGQPTGGQDATTTESGAYVLTGTTSVVGCVPGQQLHCPDALVWLPTEDEWYKAAYYKGGGIDAGYWDYATQTDSAPSREAPPGTDLVNGSALYDDLFGEVVGPPYYMTGVGEYDAKPSDSAYGTYDQNGNLREWNEALILDTLRGRRGGSWIDFVEFLPASTRDARAPEDELIDTGFRLATSAAPGAIPTVSQWGVITMALMLLCAGSLLYRNMTLRRVV
jgi:formylglycine-generating enzyme required for sulfatase activity